MADILTILLRQDSIAGVITFFTLGIVPKVHARSMRECEDRYESLVYYYDRALANVLVGPRSNSCARREGRMVEIQGPRG